MKGNVLAILGRARKKGEVRWIDQGGKMTIGWKLNSFYLELDLPFYQKEKNGKDRKE